MRFALAGAMVITFSAALAAPPTPRSGRAIASDMTERTYPWTAIGRLDIDRQNGESGHCTATLIGPARVITAAHCVRSNDKQRRFFLNDVAAKARGSAFAPKIVKKGYREGEDWAVLDLSEDLSSYSRPIPLLNQLREENDAQVKKYEGRLVVAGYAFDHHDGDTALRKSNCSPVYPYSAQASWMMTDCPLEAGASGSAVLVKTRNGYGIVSIYKGTSDFRGTYALTTYAGKVLREFPNGIAGGRPSRPKPSYEPAGAGGTGARPSM